MTSALLMRAIDPKEHHTQALEHLDSLKKCDTMRAGYYADLANKWSIEERLGEWATAINTNESIRLDLAGLNLVSLQYHQYFCVADELNLSGNAFDQARLTPLVAVLKNCNEDISIKLA